MCYNSGCHIPDDDMGHPDNITVSTFQSLSKTLNVKDARKDVFEYLDAQNADPDAAKNPDIEEIFLKASKAWGQSLSEAKKQAYNMLKSEM